MIRVLVVDDDYMVARIHRGFVERVPGFEVAGEARSGADALDAVGRLGPDLVLLDIYLPDMSGLDVLTRLRAPGGPDVDVLAVTAARDAETVSAALRGGVIQYLTKPFAFEDLRARLASYAAARRVLASAEPVAQHDIDAVFARSEVAGAGPGETERQRLPKGLSVETATVVSRALRRAEEDLSAQDCGDVTGLSRVSARRYLEHFVEAGAVQVRLQYGATGRPERKYRWRDSTRGAEG